VTRKETIGDCTLYLGDCMEVLPTLGKVDAVVTDPPYGVDFKGKATKHTHASGGYLGGDSRVGPAAVNLALSLSERGVVFSGLRLMWDYPRPYEVGCIYCPAGAGRGRWGFTLFNPMLFYGKGLPHTRRSPSGFQSFDTVEQNGHPCPKPERWMRWAVEKCSLPNQTILDPFMGSGTTGVACVQLDRKFIGIEIEERYFDIACKRIEEAYKQPKLFSEKPRKPEQQSLLDDKP
jgi:site-specific DNA-methyltransferase (adenine-specific)